MPRIHQAVLVISTLALSWLLMMAVHELGHVFHAWFSGGIVTKVLLSPLAISRTDVSPNPHPLLVAWGGAVWGCAIPLAVWIAARWVVRRYAYLPQFFAGFCLIANGAYLAGGIWLTAGDVADIVRHGCPMWVPVVCGLPLIVGGLFLWHGLGSRFGLGKAKGEVDRTVAWGVLATFVILFAVEFTLSK